MKDKDEKESKIHSIGVRNKINEIEIILNLLAKHCASNATEEVELRDALMKEFKEIKNILTTKY